MNKKRLMKSIPFLGMLLCAFLTLPLLAIGSTSYSNLSSGREVSLESMSDEVLSDRLYSLSIPFSYRYSPEVRSLIQQYVLEGTRETEALLGRTTEYFPVFEHYLKIYNLPDALKYMPMIESGLRSRVTSSAGAAGLWQFVPNTARLYGLTVNGELDERLSTYKSTEAAAKMMLDLFQQFGDWGLVLAAYNAGSARVRQAIVQAGCNDYQEVSKYLPYETRKYVPAFLAAAYLYNFHEHHNIHPAYPSMDVQDTRVFKVYSGLQLDQLASSIQTDAKMLRYLNPGYLNGRIPANAQGHFLVIPSRSLSAYLSQRATDLTNPIRTSSMTNTSYVVRAGDRIESIAQYFRCSVDDVMEWNGLQDRSVFVNQHLTLYVATTRVRP
jgi:membrane-bound lytic murein transglycosylase D